MEKTDFYKKGVKKLGHGDLSVFDTFLGRCYGFYVKNPGKKISLFSKRGVHKK